jgi:hypothetical protein
MGPVSTSQTKRYSCDLPPPTPPLNGRIRSFTSWWILRSLWGMHRCSLHDTGATHPFRHRFHNGQVSFWLAFRRPRCECSSRTYPLASFALARTLAPGCMLPSLLPAQLGPEASQKPRCNLGQDDHLPFVHSIRWPGGKSSNVFRLRLLAKLRHTEITWSLGLPDYR